MIELIIKLIFGTKPKARVINGVACITFSLFFFLPMIVLRSSVSLHSLLWYALIGAGFLLLINGIYLINTSEDENE